MCLINYPLATYIHHIPVSNCVNGRRNIAAPEVH
ncbi:hypothetical protein SLEP1_g41973 [Rubroshorea leprosula]|uniref:Uncharacterized protein n=1 Tax=Rubroshorea leprosula TaxID=152421 RepID=A0AAV5L8A1_9ROSI|nr:hypothetical protein SLEP1_g41973 [Rubroshorea leprosula]